MSKNIAAHRYAKALFNISEENNSVEKIEKDFLLIKNLLSKYPEILSLISNPTISSSEKDSFIEKLVPKDTSPVLSSFLKLLIKKHRFGMLSNIQSSFHKLFDKRQGVKEIEIISPVSFSSSFMEKLKTTLKNKFNSEIILLSQIDVSLLGGFILRFDKKEINCSFKNSFSEIKQILKGCSYA